MAPAYVPFACHSEAETTPQIAAPWEPRWPEFRRQSESLWLTYLLAHYGEWCHASDALQPTDKYERDVLRQIAREVSDAARRLGLVIDTDQRCGYRLSGHAGLPRYLHLHKRTEDREEEVVTGQLTLGECGLESA